MNSMRRRLGLLTLSASVLLVNGANPLVAVHARAVVHSSATDVGETAEAKIARAMSAGPTGVARSATIIDTDARGNIVVLREGNNGFTCMPGNPQMVGDPPMCADAAAMQWSADFKAHKAKPTNTEPGIIYMLAGATQRSNTDPYDTTSPPIPIGPHWMTMWPFDPKTTGADHTQADRRLHHVAGVALCPPACYGALSLPIIRSGREDHGEPALHDPSSGYFDNRPPALGGRFDV